MQKKFIDYGLGFPVTLLNVTMVKVRGQWTPQIPYNRLEERVLLSLSRQECRWTGQQVKFIRQHFGMTLQAFAKQLGVSHVAALKWEKAASSPAAMSWALEKDLRLFVQSKLSKDPKRLAALYEELTAHPVSKGCESVPVEIAV
jgi:DNA-binding transcriptional regulator YiaG